jgi:Emfourin
MRIEFTMEGGFAHVPGLARPAVIESEALPESDAAALVRLLEAARFFERPALPTPPRPGAADYRQYTITAQDGDRRHTVKVIEPVDPALLPLLRFLQTKARELRRGGAGA